MSIEGVLRDAAAAGFLILQARDDLRSRSVPIRRTVLCALLALAADGICLLLKTQRSLSLWEIGEAGVIAGGLLLSAIPRRGIGKGDGLSILVLGLLTGPEACLQILFAAALLCAGVGTVQMAVGRAEAGTEYPFLVFLAVAFAGRRLLIR